MKNYDRMLQLVNDFFGTRTDPDQISVTPDQLERLLAIHPATMGEIANEDGPILWLLVVPTTTEIMQLFLDKKITELELLEKTIPGDRYEALYLCSVYVLPEFRKQGLSKKAIITAVTQIKETHPIQTLYYWPFSAEGKQLAITTAQELMLPLYERE
ncbi:MAG: GNAT family N-acetyltransferase [Sphingobacteriales bacterium JAD_PAG50586_3]|nr:MAG: GNAT family N-acetyltransferase [Sphingobacteriales bacterium JAD_PAG50586_3]